MVGDGLRKVDRGDLFAINPEVTARRHRLVTRQPLTGGMRAAVRAPRGSSAGPPRSSPPREPNQGRGQQSSGAHPNPCAPPQWQRDGRWVSVGDAYQRWPQPAVYQGDLPIDQAQGDDVGGGANLIEHTVDLMPRWVTPPAPTDRPTRDPLGQARHRPARGLHRDALLAKPVQFFHGRLNIDLVVDAHPGPAVTPGSTRLDPCDRPLPGTSDGPRVSSCRDG